MEKLRQLNSTAVPLNIENIDTDQIIPARFLKAIDKTGFGANLAKGVIEEVKQSGLVGAFIGGVKSSAGGISAAIFFGYIASLLAKPKIKKQ